MWRARPRRWAVTAPTDPECDATRTLPSRRPSRRVADGAMRARGRGRARLVGSAAMKIGRPDDGEYDAYFAGYVNLVGTADVLGVLERQRAEIRMVAAGVPPVRETFAYAPGKWSIRQVFGHLGDAE